MTIAVTRRSTVGAVAFVALFAFSLSTAHAQSDPLKCQRAVLKEVSKFFKGKVKALQKCEEAKAKGKHTDLCPCPGCAAGTTGKKTQDKIDKAETKLRAGIDKQCGGANKQCEVVGDDNLAYTALFFNGATACPNFENGACTQTIADFDCTGLRECLLCIGEAVVDQLVPFLYADFDPAKFGASSAPDKAINKCQIALGKEVTKFALAKEKTVGKCWDKRYKAKHAADCPDSTASPVTAKDALKAAQKIAKSESKKIVKLCKACGGPDKDCDDPVTAVNPLTPALGGSGAPFDDLLLTDIFASVPDCPPVRAPARPDRGTVDCTQYNPLTTLADLVFCLDCVAEFKVDCLDAARVTDSFGSFAQVAPECNPTPTPTPTVTPTPVGPPGLVFANGGDGQRNRLCAGAGAGGFSCGDVAAEERKSWNVAVGDLNADGALDTIFANVDTLRHRFCAGDGTGGFTCSDVGTDTHNGRGVAIGDLDADGALDAVFANYGQSNRLCAGDGAGSFTCSNVSSDMFGSRHVALGDVDRDGNLDAVFANEAARNRLCLGDGAGGFTCSDVSSDTFGTRHVALADVDADGKLDAAFANWQAANRLCLGDGTGGFTCSDVEAVARRTFDVALADMNHDGALDAVFANGELSGTQDNRFCAGDGAGGFTCSDVSTDNRDSRGVAVWDFDRDGALDLAFANAGRNRVCTGDGTGVFSCDDVSTDALGSAAVAVFAPVIVQDAVFANGGAVPGGQRNRFCAGDGAGGFSCSDLSTTVSQTHAVAAGDFDRDGSLDVILAEEIPGMGDRLCLGNGAGGFTCGFVSTPVRNGQDIALGDFNRDGKLDAVIANTDLQPNTICLGDGAGGFTSCTDVSADARRSLGVAVGDVDRDGDLDAVFANRGSFEMSRVCLGNGMGGFTSCSDVTSSYPGVALGDLNRDGRLDAVFAGGAGIVCMGDGTGGFSCTSASVPSASTTAVALGDLDRDGEPDAVFAQRDQQNQFCAGDGAGGFTSCTGIGTATNKSEAVVIGDFDLDGALDALFANIGDQPNRLCRGNGAGSFACSDVLSSDNRASEGVAIGAFVK